MFSQLAPLFKTYLRQTEPADTRLGIRRDEKQDQGKKQQEENDAVETSLLWEDSTSVSIDALKAFLVGFLESKSEPVPEIVNDVSRAITSEKREPVNARAARAVKAYTALSDQTHTLPVQVEEQPEEVVNLVDLLKADEVRTMHVLIAELDHLARKGVQTLIIERADTFLESLVQAVRLEQSRT